MKRKRRRRTTVAAIPGPAHPLRPHAEGYVGLRVREDAQTQDAEKAAFKAGYHCRWDRLAGEYGFDPAMAPGDPDGAYAAWLQQRQ